MNNLLHSTLLSLFILLLFTTASVRRNELFSDPISLSLDTASKNLMRSRIQNNLGWAYMQAGRYSEAIEAYKRAIALKRFNIDPYYNLGSAYDIIGDRASAVYYYDFYCKYEIADTPRLIEHKAFACDRVVALRKER